MQKIILGLIVIFALMSCKNPTKEGEDAKDRLDVHQDRDDANQSAHYKSDNLGLEIKINHGKSVTHSNSKIQKEHFKFSIVLQAINIDDSFLTHQPIEASKSVNDSLQLYINGVPRALVVKECGGTLHLIPLWICEYNYSLEAISSTDEPLHIKVNLTRDNGEILSAEFNLPAPIQLLEPPIPFVPIAFSDTTLLNWQSERPIRLDFMNWAEHPECSRPLYKTAEVGAQDTNYIISSSSFLSESGCEPTKLSMILSASKEWLELPDSTFKNVNIAWSDSLYLFLFGKYDENFGY